MPNHIQILNWRRDGEDESYCRTEPFAAEETDTVQDYVEKDHGVSREAEDEEDYAHTYYVNDDLTFADGDVLVNSVTGRKFRLRLEEVQ